jgi:hypothetical protein
MSAILAAVIVYLSPTGQELFCDAVVRCARGQCHAYPIESCPAEYDPRTDTLSGEWSLAQCLDSTITLQGATFDTLGCAPDKRGIDL